MLVILEQCDNLPLLAYSSLNEERKQFLEGARINISCDSYYVLQNNQSEISYECSVHGEWIRLNWDISLGHPECGGNISIDLIKDGVIFSKYC